MTMIEPRASDNTQRERYEKVLTLSHELTAYKDLDVLLERILTVARECVHADAGSIYIKEGPTLKFSYTQNDTLQGRLAPGRKLIYSTFSIPIDNDTLSGYVAGNAEPLNIEDVYAMPPDVPYGFGRSFDERVGYRTKSVLTVPMLTPVGVIGVLQLINAKDPATGEVSAFTADDVPLIEHLARIAASALERAQMTRALILRMISMAQLRDPKETGGHVNRVAAYAVEIYEVWARKRGLPTEQIVKDKDVLRMAAMMHDVGKIAISDNILKKPGRLTDDEREVMKRHTWLGAQLFTDKYSEFDEASALVALDHHERWDGKGYPGHIDIASGEPLPGFESPDGSARGKLGEETHPFGRVVAIADVYDALSSRRAYKEAWGQFEVIETLKEDAGSHFDPEMIEAFFDSMDVLRSIAERYPG